MKVLVCAYSCLQDPDERFSSGGEGVLGWELVQQIGRYNETHVLTYYKNKSAIEEKLALESNSQIAFHFIRLPSFCNFLQSIHGGVQIYAYLWQIKAYFVAKTLHAQYHFDVFHHITYANDWMASYIGAFLPIPYVRGPGGGAHKVPKMFLQEYSFKERALNTLRSLGQWMFRHDPIFLISQGRAKAILVCNRESFEAMPRRWRSKTALFPVNGISSNDLLLSRKKDSHETFSVITAGKLIAIKQFDIAVKAFKAFSVGKENVYLTIVGEGPEREELARLANNTVTIEPWVSREELLQKFCNADVFVFPSLRDGGGAVVVEAMAMALPVVCFDIAGPGFHIDEQCGIKIKPKSPEQAIGDMSEAFQQLYVNRELAVNLGLKAKEKALAQYHWNVLGERLQKIYAQ